MNSRLLSIIRKEFIQIFRDPRTLVLIIVMPMLQLFLLGYAATTDVKNISLAVWDQSQSPPSRALLDAFRAANYFSIDHPVGSELEYTELIERGKIRAALIIPPDYEMRLLEGTAQVSLVLDGSDATVGGTALSTARLIGQSYATKVLAEQAALTGRPFSFQPPLDVRTQVWYNPDLIAAYFNVPGVIGMILYFITTLLTASSIVRERERGTIEQLIVTPIRSWELVVGKIMPYSILALIDMVKEDLVAERIAIESYSEIIRWLGSDDPTTRNLIEEILKDEEEHADDLSNMLAAFDPEIFMDLSDFLAAVPSIERCPRSLGRLRRHEFQASSTPPPSHAAFCFGCISRCCPGRGKIATTVTTRPSSGTAR